MAEIIMMIWQVLCWHRIPAWRWKCRTGEINLVARRGHTISFVEVKFCRRQDVLTVPSPQQQRRIIRAAEGFAKRRPV